jgi:hypothetical protein
MYAGALIILITKKVQIEGFALVIAHLSETTIISLLSKPFFITVLF